MVKIYKYIAHVAFLTFLGRLAVMSVLSGAMFYHIRNTTKSFEVT